MACGDKEARAAVAIAVMLWLSSGPVPPGKPGNTWRGLYEMGERGVTEPRDLSDFLPRLWYRRW